jgi:hypothetical protein
MAVPETRYVATPQENQFESRRVMKCVAGGVAVHLFLFDAIMQFLWV